MSLSLRGPFVGLFVALALGLGPGPEAFGKGPLSPQAHAMAILKDQLAKLGEPVLNPHQRVLVGTMPVPALYFGKTLMNTNRQVVDTMRTLTKPFEACYSPITLGCGAPGQRSGPLPGALAVAYRNREGKL